MKQYVVAVIGATGSVGAQLITTLETREFPVKELIAAASSNSAGKKVSFKDLTLTVQDVRHLDFTKIDLAFFATSSAVAKQYVPIALRAGCKVVDKSTAYRLEQDVPLIVPEANINQLANPAQLVANPNCCTIPLAVALNPLHNAAKIKRIIISTYQSVSGAGKEAMDELYNHTKTKFAYQSFETKVFPKPIAFNLIPAIGELEADGYTEEETKIALELQKIIDPQLQISVTCVRVPVFVGHSMSVNVEFDHAIDSQEAIEILQEADGVIVHTSENSMTYATPLDVVEEDAVFVSRIRNDASQANSLNMWICCDNLRKGAALNAVQIAENLSIDE